ncbi:MAG: response regulator transcription factor [bacterium]
MKITRILIADDHNLVRQGVVNIIESYPEFSIVAEAEDGLSMIEKYNQFKPEIILSDISMPKLTGMAAAKQILETDKDVKIIFLTMYETDEYIYKAYKLGAYGLLNKNIIKGELIAALRQISSGKKCFAAHNDDELKVIIKRYEGISRTHKTDGSFDFSEREKDILLLIARGLTSEQIAENLCISKRTVDAHRSAIMAKLDFKKPPQLIKYAMEFSFSQEKKSP